MRRRSSRPEKKMYVIVYVVGDRVRVFLQSNQTHNIPTKPTWVKGKFYWPADRPLKDGMAIFLRRELDVIDSKILALKKSKDSKPLFSKLESRAHFAIRNLEERKKVVMDQVKRALKAPVIDTTLPSNKLEDQHFWKNIR